MEKFDTLEEAVEFASTLCDAWTEADSADKRYSAHDMAGIAEAADSEEPLDEDAFYAVSPAGAIGISDDGEDIHWIFLSAAAPNERFCPQCGNPAGSGARFCAKCGCQV